MHFPLEKLCPAVKPLVVPHTVHVLGSEHVASFQLCPLASPSVTPQLQVFGAVQVASLKLCVCGGSVVEDVVGSVEVMVAASCVGSEVEILMSLVDMTGEVSLVGSVVLSSVELGEHIPNNKHMAKKTNMPVRHPFFIINPSSVCLK